MLQKFKEEKKKRAIISRKFLAKCRFWDRLIGEKLAYGQDLHTVENTPQAESSSS